MLGAFRARKGSELVNAGGWGEAGELVNSGGFEAREGR